MKKRRLTGIALFKWLGFLVAALNLASYLGSIIVMGITWQVEVLRGFLNGRPEGFDLVWINYSQLIFGILLIYIAKYFLHRTNRKFIRNVAAAYLIATSIALFVNPLIVIMGFFNIIYFISVLIFVTRPKVKEWFK